ncbi:MAG TPA: hypothetical protein PK874_02915 [Desulfobacteraceae bacterium]|nr:hypothetical protein [Desulfobacteraceae bacterium]HPJ68308.1 hypothetical protein [Desulfobacteraceae bacterium]
MKNRSNGKLFLCLLAAIGMLIVMGGPSNASVTLLSASGPPAGGASADSKQAATGPVPLILDDGSRENAIGLYAGGQFIWLNRFTPVASDFPFQLEQVQVFFGAFTGVNVGELVDIYIYEDTDCDGDPGTGAVLAGSFLNAPVQFVDDVNWSTYNLTAPIVLNGPGDVLIAVVNRTCGLTSSTYPAAIDTTASQGRSWVGFYSAGNVPQPPTMPPDSHWSTIDSVGFPGNWMIRGAGGPVADAAAIPSLSEIGIISLFILLMSSAVLFIRRRNQAL